MGEELHHILSWLVGRNEGACSFAKSSSSTRRADCSEQHSEVVPPILPGTHSEQGPSPGHFRAHTHTNTYAEKSILEALLNL